MAKKRKSVETSLDEVDRSMYSTFCSTANSLAQFYTQAMNQQKVSFQAGERHSLEKLYHWILTQQEGGSRVTTIDVMNYLRNELDCSGEEPSMSPGAPVSSGSSGVLPCEQTIRGDACNSRPRNYAFSNALSSPIPQSLQNYHISPGSYFENNVQPTANVNRSAANFIHSQSRNPNPGNSNYSSMDMHAD